MEKPETQAMRLIKLPEDISPNNIRLVISKNRADFLVLCFYWGSSPQGQEYWDARCQGAVELSRKDINYLTILMHLGPDAKLYVSEKAAELLESYYEEV
jgi:hypothetical protein